MEPLNLAICDDLPEERKALLALLEQAPIATNCTQFGSSEELLEAFRPGKFDLLLMVEGDSLQDIASFVSAKLSTIDGVISTSTGFMLKKYKESGRIMQNDEEYERLKVCP